MSRFIKMIVKCYHSFRLLLCMEGYKRAEYIRKHNLFGSMGDFEEFVKKRSND